MQSKYLGGLLIVLCLICGCEQPAARTETPGFRPSVLIEIPQTRQATSYTCGVAVLQSLLRHNGVLYRQDVLEEMAEVTPERGTTPQAIMRILEEHGIGSVLRENMSLGQLRGLIDAGKPVICFLQAWNDDPLTDYSMAWDDGHYAVAIGYDQDRVYFMDPSTIANYTYIPNNRFLVRWHDGDENHQIHYAGIVVTNPNPVYRKDVFVPML